MPKPNKPIADTKQPQPDYLDRGVDLFGQPILSADEDGQQPGVNQDGGLTLNDDEMDAIEGAWDKWDNRNKPKAASGN
jgi:hypothetical protein